jgi:hypothetical protein
MITETDQLSQALGKAEKIWPELQGKRTDLLRKVLEIGIDAIEKETSEATKQRIATVEKLSGAMDGIWPSNWKQELAEDWPR